MPKLTEARVYPIKSCGPVVYTDNDTVDIVPTGLKYDRKWMVIGPDDAEMRTQRQKGFEKMSVIQTALTGKYLIVSSENSHSQISIPLHLEENGEIVESNVWGDSVQGRVDLELSEWMSDALAQHVRLVRKAGMRIIETDKRPQFPKNTESSLADSAHILAISEESVTKLNEYLHKPVLASAFRPNLIFSGAEPMEECTWETLTLGNATLQSVKPCERCVMVNVAQETAQRRKDVLKALGKHYLGTKGEPIFGENFLVNSTGFFKVGSEATIQSTRPKGWNRKY